MRGRHRKIKERLRGFGFPETARGLHCYFISRATKTVVSMALELRVPRSSLNKAFLEFVRRKRAK